MLTAVGVITFLFNRGADIVDLKCMEIGVIINHESLNTDANVDTVWVHIIPPHIPFLDAVAFNYLHSGAQRERNSLELT